MTNEDKWDKVCSRLQRCYDLAVSSEDDRSLYINIVNYVELFVQIPDLHKFVELHINSEGKKDNAPLVKQEEKLIQEVVKLLKEIETYLLKHKIVNDAVKENVTSIFDLNEGRAVSSGGKARAMFGNMNRVLYTLWDIDSGAHKSYLKQFGKVDREGKITWSIYNTSIKLDEETARIKRIRLTKIWYHWDKLAFYYNLFSEYEKISQDWFEKKDFMNLYGTKEAYLELVQTLEINDVYQKKIETPHFFIKKDMVLAIKQFHYHFLEATKYLIKEDHKLKAIFDYSSKEIRIGDKRIRFKAGKRVDLLKYIFRSSKKFYFDEYLEKIEGIRTEDCEVRKINKFKKMFINYCVGINGRLADEGFQNFLTQDSNCAEINPNFR